MSRGFTLVELLIVIGIGAILAASTVPVYGNFQVASQLNENTSLAVQFLRTAQTLAASGYDNSRHGVYFDVNNSGKDKIILYQGSSYALRQADYDRELVLDEVLSFYFSGLSLSGEDADINFSKNKGEPDNIGTIIISHVVNGQRSITVRNIGSIEEL